jgi:hypothetical protein
MFATVAGVDYPVFWYRAGVPLLMLAPLNLTSCFGAGVTALDDSIPLVYSVMADHPLGLRPGDIILGYDGIPWRRCVEEIFAAGLPIFMGGANGSTPKAAAHCLTMSVGLNWGLFDTIDVAKYGTNDTVHLPTSLLTSLQPPYLVATEQLPVPGVPFPDVVAGERVAWGRVSGTNIGYIYALNWSGATGDQFARAVDQLTGESPVEGLIIDVRTNLGGSPGAANGGLSRLFGFDPTSNYSLAIRKPGADHRSFRLAPAEASDHFRPRFGMFHGSIAVLTGPMCGSAGDYNAFRLRFHPMVRFFGAPTSGAYTAFGFEPGDSTFYANLGASYSCRIDNGTVYSNLLGEGAMIHKAFDVDTRVWLDRDGVARGEDGVVKQALDWIRGARYLRDLRVPVHVVAGTDSLVVTTSLSDPATGIVSASIVMEDTIGNRLDSVALLPDGASGSNGLRAVFASPAAEGVYALKLVTHDAVDGKVREFPRTGIFNTLGPVEFAGDTMSAVPTWGSRVLIRLKVRNGGRVAPIGAVTVVMRSLDSLAVVTRYGEMLLGDLAPQQTRMTQTIWLDFAGSGTGSRAVAFELTYKTPVVVLRRDTIVIRVSPATAVTARSDTPVTWSLEQNYPNPFNPSTMIRYGLPSREQVTLTVFNTLGQQVSVLQNGETEPGYHEVKFEAHDLPSGVYFYRLQAGSYTETKKLLLVR